MAQDVRQRLLHDAIAGGVDGGGQRGQLGHVEGDRHAGRAQPPGELVEVGQRHGGAERRGLVAAAQHAEGRAQVGQRGAAHGLDVPQRGLGVLRVAPEPVGGDARLHVDADHRVGDHVVDLPGDPQALLLQLRERHLLLHRDLAVDGLAP